MTGFDLIGWAATVPPVVWLAVTVSSLVLTLSTLSAARRRVKRAGQRVADPDLVSGTARRKDTALTLASLAPAALFWLMVLAGSFHGLVAFGAQTLGWRDGWEFLVPGTLDGVSVTFAMLAFRAIRRGKAPDRAYRVVWGAAAASATINFAYEHGRSGNVLAGIYTGLLSVFGMVMVDEFLAQFGEGTQILRRENPKFGIRWLTWPTNTFLAAVAWRNHPPAEGTPGTVINAVANLERVRAAKREAHRRRYTPPPTPALTVPRRGHRSDRVTVAREQAATARPGPTAPAASGASGGETGRVPATAATLQHWVALWQAMMATPEITARAYQDDDLARRHFGVTGRQLRQIRHAVTTGALHRRAADLGVALPASLAASVSE